MPVRQTRRRQGALPAITRETTPLSRRHPYSLSEHAPECRYGLISDQLGHSLGGRHPLFQRVGGQTHSDIG